MPVAAKRICAHPGCNIICIDGRCDKHKREQYKGTSKNRSGDPFYHTKAWHELRDWKRTENPLCELCEKEGRLVAMSEVDHIKPRSTHPELELDSDNLQCLCTQCHSRKTARERQRAPGGWCVAK